MPELASPSTPAGVAPPPGEGIAPPRRRVWPWVRRGVVAAILLFVALVAWLAFTAPLSRSLQPVAPPSITLLSKQGQPIARRGAIMEDPVDVTTLPDHVWGAFVAIEDRRFRDHWGIDPRGILRAAFNNARAGGVREGGSTITQQLAKVAFLDADRTASRKLREVLIAFWLEAWLTKDEILSRYLSNVYFGDNVYGLRAAALHYFDRRPEKLTVAQSAMLAGLLKAPSRLAPTVNLKGARARQALVVAAMEDAGIITAAQARAARPAVLDVNPVSTLPTGTYFADWVLPAARDKAGAVYAEQTVQTTLDADLQKAAVRAVNAAWVGEAQIALVAMKPDGEVVAMVGGRDYKKSPFNRATQARRQPGSTFKLFVYLAALRAGMTPDTLVDDEPVDIAGWKPRNSGGRYRGKITLREAFARSSNVAAARIAQQVGLPAIVKAARDLGVKSPLGQDLSIALGTSDITLVELASAYAAVAGNSWPVRAHGLPPEERGWLEKVWDRPRHFDGDTHEMLLDLLAAAVNGGTAGSARLQSETFGKTGTTQDNRDAIFVGFAKGLVTAVWIGRDDNKPLPGGMAGGGAPARIWRDFMARALKEPPPPVKVLAAEDTAPEGVSDDLQNAVLDMSDALGGAGLDLRLDPDGLDLTIGPDEADAPPPPPPSDEIEE